MRINRLKGNGMSKKDALDTLKRKLGGSNTRSIMGYSIVGGTQVMSAESYPWFCYLLIEFASGGEFICGSSLIEGDTIISAAHCIKSGSEDPSKITVFVNAMDGSANMSVDNVTTVIGDSCVPEPGFDQNTNANDIAIMKIEHIPMLDTIPRIAINRTIPMSDLVGTELTVIGLGTTSSGGNVSPDLLETVVTVSSQDACDINAIEGGTDLTNSFCASAPGKDACQGDSGGPIFKDDVLYGVVSSGIGCAEDGYPGVYTDVRKYISDIDMMINRGTEAPDVTTEAPDVVAEVNIIQEIITNYFKGESSLLILTIIGFIITGIGVGVLVRYMTKKKKR